jgi:hypothetical protein
MRKRKFKVFDLLRTVPKKLSFRNELVDTGIFKNALWEFLTTPDLANLCSTSSWASAQSQLLITTRRSWNAAEIDRLPVERLEYVRSAYLASIPRALHDLKGLRSLRFGEKFNEFLSSLPDSVQILEFGERYSWPIVPGMLPNQLQELTLSQIYRVPIEAGALPKNLKKLCFDHRPLFCTIEAGALPAGLQELQIAVNINHRIKPCTLPAGLKKLSIHVGYSETDYFDEKPLEIGTLPSGLKELTFDGDFNQFIEQGMLPAELRELKLSSCYNQPLGALPSRLEKLDIGFRFTFPIEAGVLPITLRVLKILSCNYRHAIAHVHNDLVVIRGCW